MKVKVQVSARGQISPIETVIEISMRLSDEGWRLQEQRLK